MQKKTKNKSQASGGIQPQSHLVVYHVQTLNVAALKTKQDDWLVNRGGKKQRGFHPRAAFQYNEPKA